MSMDYVASITGQCSNCKVSLQGGYLIKDAKGSIVKILCELCKSVEEETEIRPQKIKVRLMKLNFLSRIFIKGNSYKILHTKNILFTQDYILESDLVNLQKNNKSIEVEVVY